MQPATWPSSLDCGNAVLSEIRIAVADGELAVSLSGDGPPLLLLHAWTLDRRMWMLQVADLADRFSLIVPDRRGFGRSSAPPDLTKEADDIARIADALGHDRIAIAGVSQGSAVALTFALASPERVSALVVAGTPLAGLVAEADDIPRDRYAMLARQSDLGRLRDEWLAHPLMHLDLASARPFVREIIADYAARDLLAPSVLPSLSEAAIAALATPLLALSGTGDTAWRIACAHYLARTAQNGSLAMIDGAGHLANIEQPVAFNAALRAFLAST
jgi:pimeloyl-ACP methyl ester carboxylesterase